MQLVSLYLYKALVTSGAISDVDRQNPKEGEKRHCVSQPSHRHSIAIYFFPFSKKTNSMLKETLTEGFKSSVGIISII